MTENVNILTIIVTCNGGKYIDKCLNNLYKSSIKTYIICVDNKSNDSTLDIIRSKFPQVQIVVNKKNLGFGQANNIGLKYAKDHNYDYVLLLNQDAYIHKNTIEILINNSLSYPEYGILSPIHLNGEGTRLDLKFSNYISEKFSPYLVSDFVLGKNINEVYPLHFVNAATWLLPIKTIKIIGGFDPIFFHYGEDDNYCQRALHHGLKIGIVPNSFIQHDRRQFFQSRDRYEELNIFEKSIKVKCANINESLQKTLNWELKELKRRILISFISFNIKGVFKWIKFYFHLKSLIPQIERSIKTNKIKGPNYLND